MRLVDLIKGRNLGHVALEVALIVIGVLLALAVQDWWEGRVERGDLKAHLLAFEDELQHNAEYVARSIDKADAELKLINKVLTAIAAETPLSDAFEEDLGNAIIFSGISPSLGAYDDLVSSGNLRLISSHELRRAISNYVYNARTAASFDNREIQSFSAFVYPALSRATNLEDLWGEYYDGPIISDGAFPTVEDEVRSREFWNAMYIWKTNVLDRRNLYEGIAEREKEVATLLRLEIEALE